MKRMLVWLVLIIAVSAFAFADHPDKMGLGVVGGSNYGGGGFGGGDIGFALKLPSMPLFWQINLGINSNYMGVGLTGDYYFIDEDLLSEDSFNLDWYLGAGGYLNLGFGDNWTSFAVGARMPVGLSWHLAEPFELWFGLAPSLGLQIAPDLHFPDWHVGGEVGFRYWL
jgi:hypothetical protein